MTSSSTSFSSARRSVSSKSSALSSAKATCSEASSRRSKSASEKAPPPRLSRHSIAPSTSPRRNSGTTSALRNGGTSPWSAGRGSSGPSRSGFSRVTAHPASPSLRVIRCSIGGAGDDPLAGESGKSRATRRRPFRRATQMRAISQSTSRRQWSLASLSRSLRLVAPRKVAVARVSRFSSDGSVASGAEGASSRGVSETIGSDMIIAP